ncbi:MAG: hypothetical protein AAF493_26200 [Pseudomonadota bacterium]
MRVSKRDAVAESALRKFFLSSVSKAIQNEKLDVTERTVSYLADLLTCFAFPQKLHAKTPRGLKLRPLADYYADYVEGGSPETRKDALRQLGDVALFTAGLFPDSCSRRVVDVDYYISMGEGAYSSLSSLYSHESASSHYLFAELAEKFRHLVDVLDSVGEGRPGARSANANLLRVYERWLHTRTRRASQRLQDLGVTPAAGSVSVKRH